MLFFASALLSLSYLPLYYISHSVSHNQPCLYCRICYHVTSSDKPFVIFLEPRLGASLHYNFLVLVLIMQNCSLLFTFLLITLLDYKPFEGILCSSESLTPKIPNTWSTLLHIFLKFIRCMVDSGYCIRVCKYKKKKNRKDKLLPSHNLYSSERNRQWTKQINKNTAACVRKKINSWQLWGRIGQEILVWGIDTEAKN